MNEPTQELVSQLEAKLEQLTQKNTKLQHQVERANLLHDVSVSLSTALDFETIVARAVNFAQHLGATSGEIHLLSDTGDVYFKSTYPERNNLDDLARRELVRRVLDEGLDAWVQQTDQMALVLDTQTDDRWLDVKHPDQTIEVRSAICAPIKISRGRLRGALSFVHPQPNHFDEQDLNLLGNLTDHIVIALENAYQVTDIKDSLTEAHLMIDISRHLSGTSNLRSVHSAIQHSVAAIGADMCAMLVCYGLSGKNLPTHAEVSFVGNVKSPKSVHKLTKQHLDLQNYPALADLAASQDILVIENLAKDERLSATDRDLLHQLGLSSIAIYPLIQRIHVVGILLIGHAAHHIFNERELALYQTLSNQTTIALEHVNQIQRTEDALAETQTLYRAGRVLAAAGGVQAVLQEALVEFVYSLGLQQGAVVRISDDRQFGELAVYMNQGDVQPVERFSFPLNRSNPSQQLMLSGQPFVTNRLPDDIPLAEFSHAALAKPIRAVLQAPMIMRGETIGWLTVVSADEQRRFSQRETDLARAMADQVTIAIQNRLLLEQTERRAEQLRAVATVGEAVTGLTDLSEVLRLTVNLIRDRFGFYHVSIFLVDDRREWAVVKASTGDVGKIMVERPHRLAVGSNSIVGFVTFHAKPRIALDVGKDAVHFNNPLLPDTRSEMALPLISRGVTIGALDVQSVEPNAFAAEDIEALQIMADQITTALETARLFEETQRRLHEQAMLYRIGTRISSTLSLEQTTHILVSETAEMLHIGRCALTLLEAGDTLYTISDYARKGSIFKVDAGQRAPAADFVNLTKVIATKQELIIYADDPEAAGREFDYLTRHHGTVMAFVPILLRDEVIGLLEIYDDRPGHRIGNDDISLLDSVALLAANAIENSRLFEAVRESQTFMKTIIDQLPDPIFIKDREHRWVVVNTSFAQGIFGLPEEEILGKSDYDFLTNTAEADFFWEQDNQVFTTGEPHETEETITDASGSTRTLYTRKVPLALTANQTRPDYLIGIIQDITHIKQRELERERLISETRRTLERTQTLFRISAALSTATERRSTFETVLGEYLNLLGLQQGAIMLFNRAANSNVAEARFIEGSPAPPQLILPVSEDRIFNRLRQDPRPLLINNPAESPLVKSARDTRSQQQVTHMLVLPLLIRGTLVGDIIIDATNPDHMFIDEDVEIGQAIADQLTIWLENRQLLEEAQYRSISLQTAAEVSRAASSILNIDALIETSVNLIRDHFDFYYVGIFLLDEAGEWAVLKAGTGEAGNIQLAKNHKLKIGGESMIGWCVAQRKARIALDVGEEAVRFVNPVLPDTRSEMALPLISRDEVLGAVTVQSTKRLAFSNEDITMLQTMADQLANAIKNAELFTQSQIALSEAETLYLLTQAISSARDEDTVYRLAINSMATTGVDAATIFIYNQTQPGAADPFVEVKAVWSSDGQPALAPGSRFKVTDFILEHEISSDEAFLVEDVATDPRLSAQMREALAALQISSQLVVPLTAYHERLGYFMASYKSPLQKMSANQIRFFTTVGRQMIVTLENIRLLDDSQKRARREEIIREITGKIRNATDVNDIMKTTITELGKVIGTSQGRIALQLPPQTAKRNGDASS